MVRRCCRMISHIFKFSICLILSVALSSCSLLSFSTRSQSPPLTPLELQARLTAREFAVQFVANTEQAANELIARSVNKNQYDLALEWKVLTTESIQQAIYQPAPLAGLIDAWVFTLQVEHYFTQGSGKNLFAENQWIAVETSTLLARRINTLARNNLSRSDYQKIHQFVTQFSAQNPFDEQPFISQSAYWAWLKREGLPVSRRGLKAVGDLSEASGYIAAVYPKLTQWRRELEASQRGNPSKRFPSNAQNDGTGIVASTEHSESTPEDPMEELPNEIHPNDLDEHDPLVPLLDDLDQNKERVDLSLPTTATAEATNTALSSIIEKERQALSEMVTNERNNITQDVNTLNQEFADNLTTQITKQLSTTIMVAIGLVIILFVGLFVLGYFLGQKRQDKRVTTPSSSSTPKNKKAPKNPAPAKKTVEPKFSPPPTQMPTVPPSKTPPSAKVSPPPITAPPSPTPKNQEKKVQNTTAPWEEDIFWQQKKRWDQKMSMNSEDKNKD